MKATVGPHLVAETSDIVERDGYHYFPRAAVRMDWLTASPKTADDLRCPHGVQFFDVTIAGVRYERAAWSYEAPRPAMADVADRVGFWNEVAVA